MRAALLSSLLAVGLAGSAIAAPVSVPLNHTVRLSLSGSAASVVVGNPNIADVTVVDSRTLFVSGKGMGSTDVVVVDGLGRTIYNAEIAVGGPRHGQVAVYRGGERTDFACSPRCEVAARAAPPVVGGSSDAGSASGSGSPASQGAAAAVSSAAGN